MKSPARRIPAHALRAQVRLALASAPRGVIAVRPALRTDGVDTGWPSAAGLVSPLLDLVARVRARRSGRPLRNDAALRDAVKAMLVAGDIDAVRLGNVTLTLGANRTAVAGDELVLLAQPLRVVVARRPAPRAPRPTRAAGTVAPAVAAPSGINMARVREALARPASEVVVDMAAYKAARKAG